MSQENVEIVRRLYEAGDRGDFAIAASYLHPEIEFHTKQGKDVVFMTTFSSNPPAYNQGDKVKVVYSGDGEDARILSFGLRFGLAWALMGAGGQLRKYPRQLLLEFPQRAGVFYSVGGAFGLRSFGGG